MSEPQQEDNKEYCKICKTTVGLRRCSKCKQAYYCSEAHQQTDWRTHKLECKKYINNIISSNNDDASKVSDNDKSSKHKKSCHNKSRESSNKETILTSKTAHLEPSITTTVWPSGSSNTSSCKKDIQIENSALSADEKEDNEILSVNAEAMKKFEQSSGYVDPKLEREKSQQHFRNLSENTMKISADNLIYPNLISSEIRYDDLCQQVIHDMNEYGLSVVDDFLGRQMGLDILNEVKNMYAAGVFKNGQLVSNTVAERDLRTIRGDKITWVKGTENGCINIGYLINQIDNVVIAANKMRDNGLLGQYKIRERTKAMVACYPGSGSHYVMHVDNPNKDGRVITAIYYLNLNWNSEENGGILKIFPEQKEEVAEIDPKFDRIIFFWSDRRNPHEVQPAHQTRYAITVWYFDAVERESALNRYRQYQQMVT